MAFIPTGTPGQQEIFFNSGYLSIGTERLADVSNVTVNMSFDVKSYRTLNSIFKRAQRRATHEASVSATVFGIKRTLLQTFFSSSSPVSDGVQFNMKDGQQNATQMLLTVYEDDDPTKPVQLQLDDPIISTNGVNLATEDFAQVPIEIMCIKISIFADNDVTP